MDNDIILICFTENDEDSYEFSRRRFIRKTFDPKVISKIYAFIKDEQTYLCSDTILHLHINFGYFDQKKNDAYKLANMNNAQIHTNEITNENIFPYEIFDFKDEINKFDIFYDSDDDSYNNNSYFGIEKNDDATEWEYKPFISKKRQESRISTNYNVYNLDLFDLSNERLCYGMYMHLIDQNTIAIDLSSFKDFDYIEIIGISDEEYITQSKTPIFLTNSCKYLNYMNHNNRKTNIRLYLTSIANRIINAEILLSEIYDNMTHLFNDTILKTNQVDLDLIETLLYEITPIEKYAFLYFILICTKIEMYERMLHEAGLSERLLTFVAKQLGITSSKRKKREENIESNLKYISLTNIPFNKKNLNFIFSFPFRIEYKLYFLNRWFVEYMPTFKNFKNFNITATFVFHEYVKNIYNILCSDNS